MPARKPKRELTLKQRLWLNAYLGEAKGNATEAARIAGYEGDDNGLSTVGSQNLRKYSLLQRIEARIEDSNVTADEVIGVLASQMHSDMSEVLDSGGHLDLNYIRSKGLGHLIKKIKVRRVLEGADAVPAEVVEVELYSSQAAATQLCKVLGIERAPVDQGREDLIRALTDAARALALLAGVTVEAAMAQLESVQRSSQALLSGPIGTIEGGPNGTSGPNGTMPGGPNGTISEDE